jgi:phosphopantetheinyl transferase
VLPTVDTSVAARTGAATELRRAGRALRDLHIAQALGIRPAALRFGLDPLGRPVLQHPAGGLDFNVAHTQGLVAVGSVRAGWRIGIDVERLRELRPERARRAFSREEWARIEAADDPATEVLLRWVRKEALLKAIGIGLRVPLAQVPSDGAADAPPTVARPTSVVDPERRWWAVWSSTVVAPGYLVAWAVGEDPPRATGVSRDPFPRLRHLDQRVRLSSAR